MGVERKGVMVESGLEMVEIHPKHQQLAGELDRLSLRQALIDVEIANARVSHLTQQMIDLEQRLASVERDWQALFNLNQRAAFRYLRQIADRRLRAGR